MTETCSHCQGFGRTGFGTGRMKRCFLCDGKGYINHQPIETTTAMSKEQTLEQEIRELNRVAQKESAHTVPLEDSFVDAVCCFIRSKLKSETEKAWDAAVKWNEEQWSGGPIGYTPALDKKQFLSHYNTNEDEPNGNKV